ncbi:heme o synthase [Rickettsia endosymbiont of Cardiosporidium cionae]|uniref:heme o synthase n=1 Tax=Rickettsia endosymbiont of Cardiosporidium cionae TaxID=2777155 RepID=UPI00189337AD|nr:heme o synthase [Rickettsia endosymbiont of Cardiosporidium cionae]KAF8818545.1 protoheme IX farnesyltransferase [Rickettsia endosymbiont of Cardiosporidium cionae]
MKQQLLVKNININITEDKLYRGYIMDYITLMKPKVILLVVFTHICGIILAPGDKHLLIIITSIITMVMGAGGAAVINMWYDKDIDLLMQRTQNRALIKKRIHPDNALDFGLVIVILSIIVMSVCVNLLSALLLIIAIAFYIFVYTMWLKRSSVHAIVVGGVSGALSPMIGWASVTGNISFESFSLFLIIFLWTPPHSWAIAILTADDYKKAKIPILPVVKDISYTNNYIVFYSILTITASLIPYFVNITSNNTCYLVVSIILNLIFLYYIFMLCINYNTPSMHAKNLFLFSILYLFGIFIALLC